MAPMNGTIKRLVSDKGFGFILASDGNEYFFHNSACADTRFDDLREGQAVTFEKGQGPKGPRGEHVRVASRRLRTCCPRHPGRSVRRRRGFRTFPPAINRLGAARRRRYR